MQARQCAFARCVPALEPLPALCGDNRDDYMTRATSMRPMAWNPEGKK